MDLQTLLQHCDSLTDGQTMLEILQRAAALIEDPARWCQGALARDAHGRPVKPASPDAVAVSIEGAIGRSSNAYGIIPPFILHHLDAVVLEVIGEAGEPSIYNDHDTGWFNDSFDHASALRLLQLTRTKLLYLEELNGL